jgi:hypothetical protein
MVECIAINRDQLGLVFIPRSLGKKPREIDGFGTPAITERQDELQLFNGVETQSVIARVRAFSGKC